MNLSTKGAYFTVEANGWLTGVTRVPSPNFDHRPQGSAISLLVIHNISLPPGEFGGDGILDLFTNRLDPEAHPYFATLAGLKVSAHFLIRRDGTVIQFVSCLNRAWHAGQSHWKERERCNDFSIGIELEGTDERPFEAAQYSNLNAVITALCAACPDLTDIAGHSDIAPGRKTDPGPGFDWSQVNAATNRLQGPQTPPLQTSCCARTP